MTQWLKFSKITFLNSSHQHLSNNIHFVRFRRGPHFSHCFGKTSLWRHFLSHDFQIYIFCRIADGLSSLQKFQCFRLSLASFTDKLRKTQLWRHHDVISCCWELIISNFVKLNIDHHPSKLQMSWLSGSNLWRLVLDPQNHHYDVILDVISITEFPN